MPKAYDPKRNYYADLELPTSASIDDIRKQYRKLALQYHPDRNAGKEEECVPKFQAIQAANEILSDPAEKAKYDSDRKGTFGGASGVRGHPYQANSNFPPPPRRTQPGQYSRPPPTAQRQNGADRFSNFNAQPQPKRPDPADARSNMFRAWENIYATNSKPQRPTPAPPPSPGVPPQARRPRPQPPPRADTKYPPEEKIRSGYSYREAHSPHLDPEGAKSAWEGLKGTQTPPQPGVRRSNTGRANRQGFDPNAASDERPASGGYYRPRHKSEDFGKASPSEPAPTAKPQRRPHIDPTDPHNTRAQFDDGEDDVPYSEGNRKRTPYTSFSGEKVDNSAFMRKSKSTKDTTKLNAQDDAFRARSSSPKSKSAHGTPVDAQRKGATFEIPVTDSEPESAGSGNGSTSPYESPFAKPANLSREPSERPKIIPSPPSRRYNGAQGPFSPPANQTPEGEKKDFMYVQPPFPTTRTSPLDRERWQQWGKYMQRRPRWATPGWTLYPASQQATTPSTKGSYGLFWQEEDGGVSIHSDMHAVRDPDSTAASDSFSHITSSTPLRSKFDHGPFVPMPTGKSRSEENINTKFSGDWNGNFSGAAEQPKQPTRKPNSKTRTTPRNTATFGQPSPLGVNSFPNLPGPPPGPPPNASSVNTPIDGKFKKEQWEQAFKDYAWNVGPPPPMKPEAGSTQADNGNASDGKVRDSGSVADEDPMDIDDTPPKTSMPPPPIPVRMMHVPPRSAQNTANVTSAPSSQTTFKTNLDDLAHTEPLAQPPNAGLKDLSGLSSTLPFKSQAATILPFQQNSPQQLAVPAIPDPPTTPPRLTKQAWQKYVIDFKKYMLVFHYWNKQILGHFTARELLIEQKMGRGMGWLEAIGDESSTDPKAGPAGFVAYVREDEEDMMVREIWNVGRENHRIAVQAFDQARKRVRALVDGGGLADA